ncbi:MAG: hypothetical protein ABSH28_24000 [Acidobacteriota bacterium]
MKKGKSGKVTAVANKKRTPQQARGREPGKRSNPEFEQVTAYLQKDLYKSVKIALIEQDRSREFSALVSELLTDWLGKAGTKAR